MVDTDQPPREVGPPWLSARQRDVLLTLGVGAIGVVGTFGASHQATGRKELDPLAFVLVLGAAALLLFRRRAPVAVLIGTFVLAETYTLLGYADGPIYLPLVIALFTAVVHGHRRAAIAMLVAGYASFLWLEPAIGWNGEPPDLQSSLALAAWLSVVYAASEVARARHERAHDRWRSQQEEARRQASEERLRIARELHDVLAHNISLINVRAGVALHLIDEQPDEARRALAAIKDASKDALGELRSVLDILRQSGEAAPREPTVGLDHLADLVADTEAAGLSVRTEIDGAVRPLPPGVDLAAYRIVQEALTNVVRHAGPALADVHIHYGDDDVTVEVVDDGRTPAHINANGGNGIPGMRERAAALGGSLVAGPRPEGGFSVRARLPVTEDA